MREADVTTALAERVVRQVRPGEMPRFDERAREFFDHADTLPGGIDREEVLGIGIEVALVTPYVLGAAAAVAKFVIEMVADEVKEESKPHVAMVVKRLLRQDRHVAPRHDDPDVPLDDEALPIEPSLARRIRAIAYERATLLGLSAGNAAVLADAIVGALVVPPQSQPPAVDRPAEPPST